MVGWLGKVVWYWRLQQGVLSKRPNYRINVSSIQINYDFLN